MKVFFSLGCFAAFAISSLYAQPCDFVSKQFGVRTITLSYGTATAFDGSTDSLKLDVYLPVGDLQTQRPVLFFVHGGGFSGGDRSEMRDVCTQFAARGYVTVSPSYRLGFYRPQQFNYPYCLDEAEFYRAVFRGIQDVKGAIRFIKNRHLQDSTHPQLVYIGGFSAGACIALAVGHLDKPAETLPFTDSIADAQTFFGNRTRPDLGSSEGFLHLGSANARVAGIINIFGAVTDTAYVESDGPPIFQYHQTNDPVVPCGINRPYYYFGFGIPDNYPLAYGSCFLQQRLSRLGYKGSSLRTWIYNGNQHNVHNALAVDTAIANWLNQWVCQSLGTYSAEKPEHLANPVVQLPQSIKIQLKKNAWVTLYDLNGRKVFHQYFEAGLHEMDAKNAPLLAPGSVILHLDYGNGEIFKTLVELH